MEVNTKTILKYLEEENEIQSIDFEILSKASKTNALQFDINPNAISLKFLKYILHNDDLLDYEKKAALTLELLSETSKQSNLDFWKIKISGLNTIIEIFENNLKKGKYNFDFDLDGKKIPVFVDLKLVNATKYTPRHIRFWFTLNVLDQYFEKEVRVFSENLLLFKMYTKTLDFGILFSKYSLYPQVSTLDDFSESVIKTKMTQEKSGLQILSKGFGYISLNSKSINLTNEKIIIEKELEYNNNNRQEIGQNYTSLPYLRVFSLKKKAYFYIHIDDILDYEYDTNCEGKLVLDDKKKFIINKIFSSKYNIPKDITKNKGAGIIILAVGEPGTGKTSTAEVYSEMHQKSLYILQVEELGINIEQVEKNLTLILERINKWKSILLFDEIDIFLSHRNEDLEKSAIVGIFLRLLEYFDGIIFFTSNRIDVIDKAVLSRVTLVLKFPNIDVNTRKTIWQNNFDNSHLTIDSLDDLSKLVLSGRDIRNYVKLCNFVYDSTIKEKDVLKIIEDFPKN